MRDKKKKSANFAYKKKAFKPKALNFPRWYWWRTRNWQEDEIFQSLLSEPSKKKQPTKRVFPS